MQRIDDVEMVDVREAAALAGRSAETIRRWVWSDRVTAVKRGGRLLLRRSEVVQLVGGQTGRGLSLAEWAQEVGRRHGSGVAGGTASDLVLQDRSERQEAGAYAGR